MRPCLVLSDDIFNHGPSELVAVLPITRTRRPIPLHVPVDPPEGGIKAASVILCDQIRTISMSRIGSRWGTVTSATMDLVEDRVKVFLSLK